jgi:hypothetical protein
MVYKSFVKGINQWDKRWVESGSIRQVSLLISLIFSNKSVQAPSCGRPKTTQRTLFLSFAFNNCLQITAFSHSFYEDVVVYGSIKLLQLLKKTSSCKLCLLGFFSKQFMPICNQPTRSFTDCEFSTLKLESRLLRTFSLYWAHAEWGSVNIRVRSHAPSIRSHKGTKMVWPDIQPMRVPKKPVYIDLFR